MDILIEETTKSFPYPKQKSQTHRHSEFEDHPNGTMSKTSQSSCTCHTGLCACQDKKDN